MTAGALSRETVRARSRMILLSRSTSFDAANSWPISPAVKVHRDDGPGNITINASRPPGAPGMNGAGVVCVLSFEAKAAGDANVEITRPAALNSKQQPVLAQGTAVNVSVK